eukprot:TRINITY_DN3307_c0_g1_i1.p1 TRINITY_DN3307_c0_g1~~TRINITY_DN3307_c0_g1_i1.p1  ORF type:complete len:181 (-),score=33.44 TRINITY_DN3307_c0_g1_i1:227-769(-)
MEPLPQTDEKKSDYLETHSGNKIHRRVYLGASKNIKLGKVVVKSGVVIRGDICVVSIGKYSIIHENTVIRPPYKKFKGGIAFFPLTIGDHVTIGENSMIEAASIGSFVSIGKNCVISRRCILKDCCVIEDNSVLPPDTVVPPFTVYKGFPATFSEELPESFQKVQQERTQEFYDLFRPSN